jgi:hypothetical protein
MALVASLALLVSGCGGSSGEDTVSLYGHMVIGPELGDPIYVLPGAALDAYDDTGALLSKGSEPYEDSPGYYRVRNLPPLTHVHLLAWPSEELSDLTGGDDDDSADAGDDDDSAASGPAEQYVPTLLSAWLPENNLYAYDGEIYIVTYSWLKRFLATADKAGLVSRAHEVYAPEIPDNGGFLLGNFAEGGEGSRITVTAGGEERDVWYTDEIGVVTAAQEAVGPAGWFLAFGLPVGPVEVVVTTADGLSLQPLSVLAGEDTCTSLIGLEIHP